MTVHGEDRSMTRWGPERRLEFIDFRLMWDRTINRGQLVNFFGISIQQASADLARYAELAPDNLAYDKSAKTYRATEYFLPKLVRSDAQLFFDQLNELATRKMQSPSLLIGWQPDCDVVRFPSRTIGAEILLRLLWSMRDRHDIEVNYQSMREPKAGTRWIAPHAFGSDGLRWHVRAWCHESCKFRDFVVSRIQSVVGTRRTVIDSATDAAWHTNIDIAIKPRAELTKSQRAAIEADYGMTGGLLVVNCRKAMAFYVLRQLHLEMEQEVSIFEQPLELENRTEIMSIVHGNRKLPEYESKSINRQSTGAEK